MVATGVIDVVVKGEATRLAVFVEETGRGEDAWTCGRANAGTAFALEMCGGVAVVATAVVVGVEGRTLAMLGASTFSACSEVVT